jgi:hypothetical protein
MALFARRVAWLAFWVEVIPFDEISMLCIATNVQFNFKVGIDTLDTISVFVIGLAAMDKVVSAYTSSPSLIILTDRAIASFTLKISVQSHHWRHRTPLTFSIA